MRYTALQSGTTAQNPLSGWIPASERIPKIWGFLCDHWKEDLRAAKGFRERIHALDLDHILLEEPRWMASYLRLERYFEDLVLIGNCAKINDAMFSKYLELVDEMKGLTAAIIVQLQIARRKHNLKPRKRQSQHLKSRPQSYEAVDLSSIRS